MSYIDVLRRVHKDVVLTACMTCGRDNRVFPLKEKHWFEGQMCESRMARVHYSFSHLEEAQ